MAKTESKGEAALKDYIGNKITWAKALAKVQNEFIKSPMTPLPDVTLEQYFQLNHLFIEAKDADINKTSNNDLDQLLADIPTRDLQTVMHEFQLTMIGFDRKLSTNRPSSQNIDELYLQLNDALNKINAVITNEPLKKSFSPIDLSSLEKRHDEFKKWLKQPITNVRPLSSLYTTLAPKKREISALANSMDKLLSKPKPAANKTGSLSMAKQLIDRTLKIISLLEKIIFLKHTIKKSLSPKTEATKKPPSPNKAFGA
ncbi:hypothetical protein KKC59_04435 [bacterium]|nr:hypothetical protein [bacterium]